MQKGCAPGREREEAACLGSADNALSYRMREQPGNVRAGEEKKPRMPSRQGAIRGKTIAAACSVPFAETEGVRPLSPGREKGAQGMMTVKTGIF